MEGCMVTDTKMDRQTERESRRRERETTRASAEWLTRKPVQCPMRRKWVWLC